jgi:hypothetical protein
VDLSLAIIFENTGHFVRFEGFHGGDYEKLCLLGFYAM